MKVIFLDIDGVLNSDEYFEKINSLNVNGIEKEVDVKKIELLKQAIDETGAKVVLSSSWRYTKNAEDLKELLLKYNIYVDSTPLLGSNKRGLEIMQWVQMHQDVENYVILDDEIFDTYDEELKNNLIKISDGNGINFGAGLLQKDVEKIIEKLGKRKLIKDKTKEEMER